MSYTVPVGATLQTIAAGLADLLNQSANTNLTKVSAFAHGDRLELRSFDSTRLGTQVPISAAASLGSAPALTTGITASGSVFLDTVACGFRGLSVANDPAVGDFLQLMVIKTNGAIVTLSITNTTAGTTIAAFVQSLVNRINTTPALQGGDGVIAEDLLSFNPWTDAPIPQFNLRARSPGWNAAQAQISLSGSPAFGITPSAPQAIDQNLCDLQPRAHLYLTAGITNLDLAFRLDTTALANGFHELTAVAYEGSHVRTQCHISRQVRIQNGPLAASLTTLLGGTNTALEATLEFAAAANTSSISRIELFSTSGSLGFITSQPAATFSVPASYLGIGRHPFYTIVTTTDGHQARSETKWIRIIGPEPPFPLTISGPPPTITWPATAGRAYEVLGSTAPAGPYQLKATVTPSNSAAQWTPANISAPQGFYRVSTAH